MVVRHTTKDGKKILAYQILYPAEKKIQQKTAIQKYYAANNY
jgi:ribosomal protein S7